MYNNDLLKKYDGTILSTASGISVSNCKILNYNNFMMIDCSFTCSTTIEISNDYIIAITPQKSPINVGYTVTFAIGGAGGQSVINLLVSNNGNNILIYPRTKITNTTSILRFTVCLLN